MSRMLGLVAVISLVVFGCGGPAAAPPPITYPTRGTVTYRDGTPLTSGMVQFISSAHPTITVTGAIGADGRFEAKTMHLNQNLPGAIEGSFQVTVLPFTLGPNSVPEPVTLPDPFVVKPGDNSFVIVIDKPKP